MLDDDAAAATGLLAGGATARRGRNGLARRNDELLTRRQRAWPLVAVGLQDCGARHVVALGEDVERVAGADDDRGAAMRGRTGGRDRARRHRGRGFNRRTLRRRIGRNPAPSSRHAAGAGRISRRRNNRGRRQRLGLELRRLRLRPRILRRLAALDSGRAHRTGRFRLRGKGVGKGGVGKTRLHIGAAAGKANRHQRQHRDLRHPTRAKQLGDTGHGYSLVRNKILF